MKDKTLNTILIFLIVGIVLVAFAPYLFTRPLSILDFSSTGAIGDTIGGITAPITSLIGSILVFFALKAQIDANKIIQRQIESQKNEDINRKKLQNLNDLINMVKYDINGFNYTTRDRASKQKFNYEGSSAIYELMESIRYVEEINHSKNVFVNRPKLSELYNILQIINMLFDTIEKEEIDNNDKQFYNLLLSYQYKSKVRPFISNVGKYTDLEPRLCKICGKAHDGIPIEIFDLLESIGSKSK